MNLAALNTSALRIRMWAIVGMLAMLVMECSVMALWYEAVFEEHGVAPADIFLILFAVIGISYSIARGSAGFKWNMLARQGLFLAWLLLAMFASLKLLIYPITPIPLGQMLWTPIQFIVHGDVADTSFFHLIVIMLIVWRGAKLAHTPLALTGVHGSFQLYLIALLLYGMIYGPLYPVEASVGLYVFLFCGLVAMSAVRISNLSETRGGRIPRFSMNWMVGIVFSGLMIVGLAILAGWLSSGQVREILSTIIVVIFSILTAIVLIILSPLLFGLVKILPALSEFLEQLLARLRNLPVSAQIMKLIDQMNQTISRVVPYVLATRGFFLAGILVVAVLVVLLALRLRSIRRELIEEEESEAAASSETDSLLKRLLSRFLRDTRLLRGRTPGRLLAAARIRQIYRHLTTLSQKLGAERQPSTTPLEFLPIVAGVIPDEEAELEHITNAYQKIRYGEYPETRQEVEAIEADWQHVRSKGRSALALQKRALRKRSGI